jgi:N-acetylmuramoyl-L-alanine amidase
MIRTTDTSVYTEGSTIAAQKVSDLKQRVRIVNETQGALLVSIHQNTFPGSKIRGAQVFYAPTAGSRELAQLLQSKLYPDRTCKTAGSIYLLQHIRVPGVLIECGFLSNPEEEARLRSGDYQQYLCAVIGSCLREIIHANG